MLITLKQDGNGITGTDSTNDTEITGTIEGDTIRFEFWSRRATAGIRLKGEWKVVDDGSRLKGFWGYVSSGGTSGK